MTAAVVAELCVRDGRLHLFQCALHAARVVPSKGKPLAKNVLYPFRGLCRVHFPSIKCDVHCISSYPDDDAPARVSTGGRPTEHYYMFWSSIPWRTYTPPSSLRHIYLFRGVLQPQEDEDGRLCRYLCILNDAPNDVLWRRRIKVHGNLNVSEFCTRISSSVVMVLQTSSKDEED